MIQYSGGTYINRTAAIATRQDVVNLITLALQDAGWTTISGTPGTSNDVVQESTPNNQGNKIRIRTRDPGSGVTSAQVILRDPSGALPDATQWCAPSNTWRVIASKRQFFAFMTGATNKAQSRSAVGAGTFWVPAFIPLPVGSACGFLIGAGTSDTDSNGRNGWRSTLRPQSSFGWQGYTMYGGVFCDNGSVSGLHIPAWQGGPLGTDGCWRWDDNTLPIYEALLASPYGSTSTNEFRFKGQLYDAAVIAGQWAGESLLTFDGHTWMAYTDMAIAGSSFIALATLILPVS